MVVLPVTSQFQPPHPSFLLTLYFYTTSNRVRIHQHNTISSSSLYGYTHCSSQALIIHVSYVFDRNTINDLAILHSCQASREDYVILMKDAQSLFARVIARTNINISELVAELRPTDSLLVCSSQI